MVHKCNGQKGEPGKASKAFELLVGEIHLECAWHTSWQRENAKNSHSLRKGSKKTFWLEKSKKNLA